MPDIEPPSGDDEVRLPHRRQFLLVAAVALAVLVLMGIPALVNRMHAAPASAAPLTPPGTFRATRQQLASLKIAPVQTMQFRSEVATDGSIAYNDDTTTPVFSPYSGRVTKLIAKPGDAVRRGAPLMAVEASEFVQGQNDLIAAASALATAHAQVTLTEMAEKRQHELYLAKAGALKDWLQAQADFSAAQNTLRSAEIALASARNRLHILGKSEVEIQAIEQSRKLQTSNPEARVLAPISGVVTQRQVGLGQYITSAASGGANPVYSISNLATVWLIANVRETDAPYLRIGQPVEVHALAYPDRSFKAKVDWIAPAMDVNTRRISVRAVVDNPNGALKPLMFANFSIATGDASIAPAVPQSAIVYEGSAGHVFVAGDEGTLTIRPIGTGRTKGDWVEATSGLSAGEKIVTAGTLFIDRAAEGK